MYEKYHDVEILSEEANTLRDIEGIIKKPLRVVDNYAQKGVYIENKQVMGLNLFSFRINELPNSIGNLRSLVILNLRDNKLKYLPESFCNLKSLKELDLCWNELEELPKSFGNLKSLEKICLSYNKLRKLPESINSLKSLEELDLDINEISEIPKTIGELKNLRILKLNDNKLDSIPTEIENLENLKEICLDDNWLTKSSQDFLNKLSDKGVRVILPENFIFEERYRFFSDTVFLTAWLNTETSSQKIIMQKINPATNKVELQDEIDCIHTAVLEIPVENIEEVVHDENFAPAVYNIMSSEKLYEIDLDNVEKFKALKSWVAGIAESGIDAFKIQTEIDAAAKEMYPLAKRILRFMAMADPFFIPEFLEKVARECYYEGIRHESSVIANFTPILDMMVFDPVDGEPPGPNWEYNQDDKLYYLKTYRQILSVMFDLDLPLKLFTQNRKYYGFLRLPDAVKILNFQDAFFSPDHLVRKSIALNSEAVEFDEFNNFLTSKKEISSEVREAATQNPNGMIVYKKILDQSGTPFSEKKVLRDLSTIIGKPIPRVDHFIWDEEYLDIGKKPDQLLGVIIEKSHIIGLGIVFQHDSLTYLPESIGNLKKLRYLGLYNNGLVLLPDSLRQLQDLRILSLGRNKLKKIPESIGNLKNLRKLSLDSNLLETLPESISDLTALEELNLKRNYFEKIPESVRNFKDLRFLNVEKNAITIFPDFICSLVKLRELNLESNYISQIPECIRFLKDLQKLLLGTNKIESIPKAIRDLDALIELRVNTNKITSIPNEIVNLRNLKSLNLAYNNIEELTKVIDVLKKNGCKVIISNVDYDSFPLSNKGILEALNDNIPYDTNELAKKMKIQTAIDVRNLEKKLQALKSKNLILSFEKGDKVVWKLR